METEDERVRCVTLVRGREVNVVAAILAAGIDVLGSEAEVVV